MENFALLVITAVGVSADSFVVSFGVSINKKANLTLPCAVAIATLLLCLATTFLGVFFAKFFDNVNLFGAILLFCLGVANLSKQADQLAVGNLSLKQCFSVGFAVGLDGAVANFALVADGFALVAPIVITFFHFLTVLLGQFVASKTQVANTSKLSATVLLLLALLKLIS